MNNSDESLWAIAEQRIAAIDWLDTTVESGDYSDTYFKELAQLFACNENIQVFLNRSELEACNKALEIAKFLLKDAGYSLFKQSIKTDSGYEFLKEHIKFQIDWGESNNAFERFANTMRERSKQEQLSREYYGDCYGYDYYLGRVHKNFIPPIPEELVEMVMPYAMT